jgi:hypothetical protein
MNQQQRGDSPTGRNTKYAFLFPAGLGAGIAIGAAIRNIGVGLAIGAAIGTTLSLLGGLHERRNRGNDAPE